MRKLAFHEINGVICCLSGLRIGGSDDVLQIGGTDLTCVKHEVTKKPYIPGSSLKGKLRSELEAAGFADVIQSDPCGCGKCIVCAVFGPFRNTRHDLGPTRIIVRDGQLLSGGDIERKSSTAIDRQSGAGLHGSLRSEERVVAGSLFSLRIGIQIWDRDENAKHTNHKKVEYGGWMALVVLVLDGLKLVQRTGLGSGVSKGSGEIQFEDIKLDGQPIPKDLW